MSIHNRIDYFELSTDNLTATKDFYSTAFGWLFTDYGPDYAGFGYSGANGEAGGIAHRPDRSAPLAIIYSDNLAESERKIRDAGGNVVKPIFSFPGGRRFHFTDPSGNELAVWSDK